MTTTYDPNNWNTDATTGIVVGYDLSRPVQCYAIGVRLRDGTKLVGHAHDFCEEDAVRQVVDEIGSDRIAVVLVGLPS